MGPVTQKNGVRAGGKGRGVVERWSGGAME